LPKVFIFLSSQVVTISVFEDIANLHIIAVCTNTRKYTWHPVYVSRYLAGVICQLYHVAKDRDYYAGRA